MIILIHQLTERLKYTLDTILGDHLGLQYTLTQNTQEFILHSCLLKINYTEEYIPGIPWIRPSGLLSDKGIRQMKPEVAEFKGIKIIFPCDDPRQALPFDIFSAVFYMLSRYEEYLPFQADHYQRFPAKASLAYQHGFLHVPVVDHWINCLSEILKLKSGMDDVPAPQPAAFRFLPTIDVDVAYAYKGKGLIRNTGGFLRALSRGDFTGFIERAGVLSGRLQDPYDTFDFIMKIHQEKKLRPNYFILFADYGPKDKNIPVKNPAYHALIRKLAREGNIGIHPSFASFRNPDLLEKEISRLSFVLNSSIIDSRQHFLLLSLPETYRKLIIHGIQRDFTMGFADQPGFRSGSCKEFYFYDLGEEKKTALRIFPFTVMDGTLKDYLKLDPASAREIISKLMQEVRKVNGTFISLWHNESFSENSRWKGWRELYVNMLDEATQ